jgi:hypothetical protein
MNNFFTLLKKNTPYDRKYLKVEKVNNFAHKALFSENYFSDFSANLMIIILELFSDIDMTIFHFLI